MALSKTQREGIKSRTLDIRTGKVYTGQDGRDLRKKIKEKQAYYERNRDRKDN